MLKEGNDRMEIIKNTGQMIICVFCERSNHLFEFNLAFAKIDGVIGCFNCWNNVSELLLADGILTMQDKTADIVKMLIADSE